MVPYVQPRRKEKSSTPNWTTGGGGGEGFAMIRARTVIQEVVMPSRAAKRAPSLPQVAKPISWMACERRHVIRARGSTKGMSRSVKILRGHSGRSQKNLRTWRMS